jgi:hypothetical protein
MTIRSLLTYLEEKPSRWTAPLFIVTATKEGFTQSRVLKIEMDENDSDMNCVIQTMGTQESIFCLNDVRHILLEEKITDFPIYSRRYVEEPVVVEGDAYTHLDTPIDSPAESESGAVGLFEQKN